MASISTRAPRGNPATATVARAGGSLLKNSPYTSFTRGKSAMSARKIVALTTCAALAPAASSTAIRFFITWRASATTSPPPTICPLAGSSAICPEQYTTPPATTACEYAPMACGALSLFTTLRALPIPRS